MSGRRLNNLHCAAAVLLLAAGSAAAKEPARADCSPKVPLFSVNPLMPIVNLSTSVTADGAQIFQFTMTQDPKQLRNLCLLGEEKLEAYITASIGQLLAARQWCLHGWSIEDRSVAEVMKPPVLIITGRCKAS